MVIDARFKSSQISGINDGYEDPEVGQIVYLHNILHRTAVSFKMPPDGVLPSFKVKRLLPKMCPDSGRGCQCTKINPLGVRGETNLKMTSLPDGSVHVERIEFTVFY